MRQEFIDVHCHILPGLDDGSPDWNVTEEMLRMELDQGACGLIVTPHFWKGRWTAPPERVRELASQLEEKGRAVRPDFFVAIGNEIKYYGATAAEDLAEGRCLSLGGTRYVLLEFSYECSFSDVDMAVNRMKTKGFRPVLAHVERYKCLHRQYDRLDQLIQRGAYIQVNADSLDDGSFGSRLFGDAAFIKKLLQYDMIHLVGTDAHNDRSRAPQMDRCYAWLTKKCGEKEARRLLYEHPLTLLDDKYL